MNSQRKTCPECHGQFVRERGTRRRFCYRCRPSKIGTGPDSYEPSYQPAEEIKTDVVDLVHAELESSGSAGTADAAILLLIVGKMLSPTIKANELKSLRDAYEAQMKLVRASARSEDDGGVLAEIFQAS